MKEPAHLALHPFGQIPNLRGKGDISRPVRDRVDRLPSRRSPMRALLPDDGRCAGGSRAITWMFARAQHGGAARFSKLTTAKFLEGDKPWSKERLPLVEDRIRKPV